MNILSLYDGMSCGMIAMQNANVKIDRYVAYEIDKYAVKTSKHNFPMIEHMGDVFDGNFAQYEGFDFLIGGSPCTYWSIAQKNNRETEASGLGWELFSQYVRALHEAKPKYFIYENNKSMSTAIRDSIRETFGFEEICINSALVSAQNRQRYYWVGKRNADGAYSKVDVQQPDDRGIMLKDILDYMGSKELTDREMEYMVRETKNCGNHFDFGYIQKGYENKSKCLVSNLSKGVPYNVLCEPIRVGCMPSPDGTIKGSQANRVYSVDGKSVNQVANGGGAGAKTGLYAIPLSSDGKAKVLTASYYKYAPSDSFKKANPRMGIAEEVFSYATPTEWDEKDIPTKAVSGADGKVYTVYQVLNGNITIRGKAYPIKLVDGFYIIRKLTVTECMRLQTVPQWYDFSCVSNTQAYKMLGNGWTCDVITHLINSCLT